MPLHKLKKLHRDSNVVLIRPKDKEMPWWPKNPSIDSNKNSWNQISLKKVHPSWISEMKNKWEEKRKLQISYDKARKIVNYNKYKREILRQPGLWTISTAQESDQLWEDLVLWSSIHLQDVNQVLHAHNRWDNNSTAKIWESGICKINLKIRQLAKSPSTTFNLRSGIKCNRIKPIKLINLPKVFKLKSTHHLHNSMIWSQSHKGRKSLRSLNATQISKNHKTKVQICMVQLYQLLSRIYKMSWNMLIITKSSNNRCKSISMELN